MPSNSYQRWSGGRAVSLDEIENAHASVGGTGPGRRYATQQINQAYAVLLSSQFQRFCRDLHSECVEHLVRSASPTPFRSALRRLLIRDRKLDKGNPNPSNIEVDVRRFGLVLWQTV